MTQSRLANAHNYGMDSYGHIISPQSQVLEGEYDRTKEERTSISASRPPAPSVPPIRFRRCRGCCRTCVGPTHRRRWTAVKPDFHLR